MAAKQTAFLSHSHHDKDAAKGLQVYLKEKGWDVYIDWEDSTMPETPNRSTAQAIQGRIKLCNWFLFLATKNSTASRWCPWEIGYADGVKSLDSIVVIPTSDRSGRFYGNEYLQLYRRIDVSNSKELRAFPPGKQTGLHVRNLTVPR